MTNIFRKRQLVDVKIEDDAVRSPKSPKSASHLSFLQVRDTFDFLLSFFGFTLTHFHFPQFHFLLLSKCTLFENIYTFCQLISTSHLINSFSIQHLSSSSTFNICDWLILSNFMIRVDWLSIFLRYRLLLPLLCHPPYWSEDKIKLMTRAVITTIVIITIVITTITIITTTILVRR